MLLEKECNTLVNYGKKLLTSGLTKSTGGNLSVFFNRELNLMAITPSGIPYDSMTAEDVVVMNRDGEVVESHLVPSSEWEMHLDLYKTRTEFSALVHTHSKYATTLACLREELPAINYLVALAGGENVRCAEYALYGTKQLGLNALAAMKERCAVLLANHGLNVAGDSMMEAFSIAEQIEFCCGLYIRARNVGKPVLLTSLEMSDMLEKVKNYGQKRE